MSESLYRPRPEAFQVGIATDPQPEDKFYTDERQAIDRASRMHEAHGHKTPVAVWDDRQVIVHLFLCGEQFRRV